MPEVVAHNRWWSVAKFRITFGLLSSLFLLSSPLTASHAGLIMDDGFESGTYMPGANLNWAKSNWANVQQPIIGNLFCCDHSINTVSSPARSGKYAVKMEYKCGDEYAAGRPRVQLSRAGKGDADYLSERWYGFSIYVPSNWVNYSDGWLGLFDIHGNNGNGQPISLHINGGQWQIFSYTPHAGNVKQWVGSTGGDKGKWTDWVFHIKFDDRSNGNGFLEAWKNGNKVLDYRGRIGDTSSDPYMKIGPQISPSKYYCPRTVYYDNIRIGNQNSSLSEMSSGGGGTAQSPPSAPTNLSISVN